MSEDEKRQEMRRATLAVLDRMVQSGWIKELARSGGIASLEFTDDGEIARRILRGFLLANGGSLPEIQLRAFLSLIASTSDLPQ